MNPAPLTLDEVHDWLFAELVGGKMTPGYGYWCKAPTVCPPCLRAPDRFGDPNSDDTKDTWVWSGEHPLPATLDAAAAAMPLRWYITVVHVMGLNAEPPSWAASGVQEDSGPAPVLVHAAASTEILVRYYLAREARMKMKGKA